MDDRLQQQLNDALAEHQYELAYQHCEALIATGEDNSNLRAIKGWCLYQKGEIKEAEKLLVDAFNADSSQHYAATMVMSFYMERGNYQQLITIGQFCVGVHPRDRLMWHRLGTAHFLLGDMHGAEIAFRRSLQVEYTETTAFALCQPLLCQGKYNEGLALYEHRFDSHPKLNWPQSEQMPMPQWQGEPLQGKSVLVWAEQGLGDCIQFCRIISNIVTQGAAVDLMLSKEYAGLKSILSTLQGVGDIIVITSSHVSLTQRYDFHCPMMSLMHGIGMTTETIPCPDFPYLRLPSDNRDGVNISTEVQQRKQKLMSSLSLTETNKLNVGIVWTTALLESFSKKDRMHFLLKDRKSLRSSDVLPVLKTEGVRFFSLHVKKSNEVQQALDEHDVIDLSDGIYDFTDTATAIEAMDLIISVDTAVAHLAGAMNKPVINLLPYVADWRWQNNREDSPWYPSMRLLRQVYSNDWSQTVQRLSKLLMKIKAQHKETGAISVFQ